MRCARSALMKPTKIIDGNHCLRRQAQGVCARGAVYGLSVHSPSPSSTGENALGDRKDMARRRRRRRQLVSGLLWEVRRMATRQA
jgi:hypothetical protein